MSAPDLQDVPRPLAGVGSVADRVFRGVSRGVGIAVLVVFGAIGIFLALQALPTLSRYGTSFFTENDWLPERDQVGMSAVLLGTLLVGLIAMLTAFPLSLATALYITEFAPNGIRKTLVAMVDLMAAVPSIIYGLWGFWLLQPRLIPVAHWLHQYLGWIPFFHADTDPNAPAYAQSVYTGSAFIAGLVVAMMVIPITCAVMRDVFAQAPVGEREAALALGATRWGMIRTVVLPFGRGGIVGGTMLGLGRALGETVAVLLIISVAFDIKIRILETGTITVSSLIANRFGEATAAQLSALLTAGFVLFVITVIVNTIAAIIVSRSRSGAATEI
ncbi:phosphate ABC transporter permease subunit PstC [Dactylosporangium sp. AC04546]|uniref:phosphate ABC transporter permease subunit PstC n=1 Tax=Dactylosporangium sp. AC04546 TaxID=2862460 RepID=UPI001EDCAFBB|nr:phosphate ABC transporter permease subunit PstC [Dactylosporangium sp. AC04546]WVK85020.1 phosphate ABC transporter permease subunit PstC [Dactylosporangium sp. AC04546]